MGALPQPRINQSPKKPPAVETKRDQYGRDPESASERLRASSDFDADTGYSPLYHAALADLPRLSSGAVCYAFVLVVNMLSYGRGKDKTGKRFDTTLPISAQALADLCRANVRDIQRQIIELAERGLISVKKVGRVSAVQYLISLRYRDWRAIEDYAVWKRRQVVSIDSVDTGGESDDTEALPISKEAVKLTKKPEVVRPGRASRAKAISVGVKSFRFQSNDNRVDLTHEAVIDSGCLVVSVSSSAVLLPEPKGEDKANVARHGCRDVPANGGSQIPSRAGSVNTHICGGSIKDLFDPLLQKCGARLLSGDPKAVNLACAEVGAMPHDYLVHYVMTQRASRPISGPRVVASIVKDAREHFERGQSGVTDADIERMIEAERKERERKRAELRRKP